MRTRRFVVSLVAAAIFMLLAARVASSLVSLLEGGGAESEACVVAVLAH